MEALSNQHLVTAAERLSCSVCKETLPADEFYEIRSRSSGRRDSLGVLRSSRCKTCQNNDYLKLDQKTKMLYAARKRAKLGGFECTITKDDIVIPETCPVLGIPLFARVGAGRSNRDQAENSPSLDRIDNSKGYVPGNIAVISMRANMIKNNATLAELKAIVSYIETSHGE
jgi:hypothetical protein